MIATELGRVRPGSHVCWAVSDDHCYRERASMVLRGAERHNEKAVLFGPEGSAARHALASLAVEVADPRTAVLHGGPLDPEAMFAMFRAQTAIARDEGYRGLRVVADMDWLLPARSAPADIVAFEVMLDRHARDLAATIVCSYRMGSFDAGAIEGAMCVHPIDVGSDEGPPFRLVAADGGGWRLTGEVDVAVVGEFTAAVTAVADAPVCIVDASGLEFIDVAGMRALADAAWRSGRRICVVAASALVRRSWKLAGFCDGPDPLVQFAA